MIIFLLCTVPLFLFLNYFNWIDDKKSKISSKIGWTFGSGFISFFGGGLAFVILMIIIDIAIPKDYQYSHKLNIVAMQDNNSYIISRHNVDSDPKYAYMTKEGDGAYISRSAPQNSSRIFETNSDYRVDIYYKLPKNRDSFLAKQLEFFTHKINSVADTMWYFYIPKGSIKQDFNIDLK